MYMDDGSFCPFAIRCHNGNRSSKGRELKVLGALIDLQNFFVNLIYHVMITMDRNWPVNKLKVPFLSVQIQRHVTNKKKKKKKK